MNPNSLISMLFLFFFSLTISTSTSATPYARYCNNSVPESDPTTPLPQPSSFLRFYISYHAGGNPVLGPRDTAHFYTLSASSTLTPGVLAIDGSLSFFGSRFIMSDSTRRSSRTQVWFRLNGYWSQDDGKLCMIGSGIMHPSLASVSVGLMLNYPNASDLESSLVTGTLECLDAGDDSTRFSTVSIMGFSLTNYEYKLVDVENENGGFGLYNRMQNASLGFGFGRAVCWAVRDARRFELEYTEDCGKFNCDPLGGGSSGGILPGSMSLNQIECTMEGRVRYLIDFSNTSSNWQRLPVNPSTILVAEGLWNGKKKHLDLVACRVLDFNETVANASLGDCSIRLSLRFPSTVTLRRRSTVVGQMWSSKSVNDSGYVGRVSFESSWNGNMRAEGLRYEYTEVENLNKSCMGKVTGTHRNLKYPNRYSTDLRFDMTVQNSQGQVAWGYSSPLSVGDRFYAYGMQPMFAVPVNDSLSGILNISYNLGFTAQSDFQMGGEEPSTKEFQISAEGTYDAKTGTLCMKGCRHLDSQKRTFVKNESLDCEIFISIQYAPLNGKYERKIKGTIESKRNKSHPLHFERIELFGNSISMHEAKKTIWRMDLEITMVLISNTLACLFLVLQLFHVKKNPDVLPFISVMMLTVLTLAHMIPLVLNFEALFVGNRNQQNVFLGSGGWLEVNEVLVRVITMVAFLLQFRLLQQTWSKRVGGAGSWDGLWVSDKKVLYFSLPLYIGGGLLAWFVYLWKHSHNSRLLRFRQLGVQQLSFWGDFKSFAGLVVDGFLLPQIVFNVFCNSKERALAPAFYVGTTVVRLLPHAYDLYRAAHGSRWSFGGIYANPRTDYYSTAWDITISCGGLMFVVLIYLQQRFGSRCFIPKRFRESAVYEKLSVIASTELTTREVIS